MNLNPVRIVSFLLVLAVLSLPGRAEAVRIKDIATFSGVRDNQLIGYGLVVGLAGTGDKKNSVFTLSSMKNMMDRMGVGVDADALKVKNVASVMVTARMPVSAKPGTRLDVTVSSVVYWTFGSLGRAGWREIGLLFVLCLLAFCFFFWNRWNYNALESGSAAARSLGVRVDALTLASLTVCALTASAAVAFAGCISFIGLLSPHMVRRFTGSDCRFLLPGSALAGAAVLLAADVLSRVVIPPTVLPIGAITSFLGAPVFLSILLKGGRQPCWK